MPTFSEEEWLRKLSTIEGRLRLIATRPVDLKDPKWRERLGRVAPLDEAGVRDQAQDLLHDLLDIYSSTDDSTRTLIRSLFLKCPSFAWATSPRTPLKTSDGARVHLLHFSVLDQGQDPRDAKLWLDDLLQEAREAGVDVNAALREVAAISNRESRHSWGSTHEWLINRLTRA